MKKGQNATKKGQNAMRFGPNRYTIMCHEKSRTKTLLVRRLWVIK